ncbi:LPS assembly lipoprotein LptE [Aquirufa sp. ROCK-SH2]
MSQELKSIQITNVRIEAAGGPTNLGLEVNEKLKEYFQRNTSLKLSTQNPDLLLEGTIVGYELSPQAPTSDDKAGLNRITLRILFKLSNRLDEEKNFEQEFSFYQDFPQNQTLSQVEKALIPKMVDQIILDLFNKIAGDW